MLSIIKNSFINKTLLDSQIIECIWTILPAIILIQIALPSLLLLYMLEESINSSLTIKIVGHQWYWRYEYTDFWSLGLEKNLEFDSYLLPEREREKTLFRLLDVDNRVILPYNTYTRIIVSSADVLHAWTVPSLGVKVDAVPGRLNQLKFICQRPGIFFGQCSEICGANHRFIPIILEIVNINDFLTWILFMHE